MSTVSSKSGIKSYDFATPAPIVDKSKRTATTTSTTTTPPLPHKHEYERTMSQGRIRDADIERLKDAIREMHGMRTSTAPPRRRRSFNVAEPPRIAPKTNETARIRLEWRAYRLYQRCGAMLEPPAIDPEQAEGSDNMEVAPDDTEVASTTTQPPKRLLEAMLRQAKHLTPEQIEDEVERRELERLRELAITAKVERDFRANNCSTYRYRLARGEPVISSQFRETYADYLRPPFANAVRRLNLRYTLGAHHRPTIDKRTHIWLWPVDDDDVPLHWQPKETPSGQKGDRRSARERARPPLRKRAKADRIKERKATPATKRPWNYLAPRKSLLASALAGLVSPEMNGITEPSERGSG